MPLQGFPPPPNVTQGQYGAGKYFSDQLKLNVLTKLPAPFRYA
jgi:hypothetical protein